MGDTTRGRIYRLIPKGQQGYASRNWRVNDYSDLKDHSEETTGFYSVLSSPNICTRTLGIDAFKKQMEKSELAASHIAANPVNMKADILSARCMYLKKLIHGMSPGVRNGKLLKPATTQEWIQQFIRLESDYKPSLALEFYSPEQRKAHVVGWLMDMGENNDISVARELLIALRLTDPVLSRDWFYSLANRFDGQDRTYLSALNIACGTDPARREAIFADFEKHFPAWDDKTAWLVWELRPPTVIAKLGRKLAVEVMTPLQTELALGALAASTGVDGGESLLKLLDDTKVSRPIRAAAIKALLKYLPGKWSSLKDSFLVQKAIQAQMTDGEMLPVVVELVPVCERKDFQGFLERLAFNTEGHPNQVRYAAIAGLGKLKTKESADALVKLLIQPQEPATRKEIITALGKMGTKDALVPLQTYFLDNKLDAEPRRMALEGLAGSRAGTTWLLERQAKKELPDAMVAETGRLLRSSPFQDLRNKALIAFPIARKMDVARLPSPSILAQKTGNAEHGKQIVLTNKDLGCIKCHGFQGIGGHIGPDLSMIGIKGSKENLFESILTPDKAIADQFVQHVVETKNGVIMTGLLVEETSDYLVLRDANGKDTKLALREIESRNKSTKSIMPDNLVSFLTEDELVDVVAYLTTLKSPALSIDRWQVVGPFPSDKSDSGLKKQFGPEAGYSSSASYPGKKGPVKWTNINTNAAGYLDLAELHGDDGINSVSYVYAEIDAPKSGWGDIKLGTDDGVNVIFNGKLVYQHRRHEAAQPGRDTIAVEFQKGKNTLLLQVSNGDNPHGVYCTVLTPGSEPARLVTPR